MAWWVYALVSATAASATALLAKVGLSAVSSDVAMAVRTSVVVVLAWVLVVSKGELPALETLSSRALLFLGLSGLATGVSWWGYFRALQLAPASRVAPVDKASLGLTIVLAWVLLGEPVSWKVALGALLVVCGALLAASG